jgi:large subunit ribosomal protein L7/L12
MATMTNDQILEAIGTKTVVELAELIEAFKAKFNVSVVAAAAAGGGGPGGRRADRVLGDLEGRRREEDPGHQGDP